MLAIVTSRVDEAFAGSGLRPTPQRYAVLEFLARRPVHATAEEIFHAVNRKDLTLFASYCLQ
jgi:Fe2+ or Zn2+ uptake regulation protein